MTHINLITADDLQLFKKELLNEIRLLLMHVSLDRKWMKGNEIREMLNISQATLQKLKAMNQSNSPRLVRSIIINFRTLVDCTSSSNSLSTSKLLVSTQASKSLTSQWAILIDNNDYIMILRNNSITIRPYFHTIFRAYFVLKTPQNSSFQGTKKPLKVNLRA